MNSKKIIIVVLAILVSIGITISTYKNLEGTNVEEIEEKQKNLFAIKVDNGSGNYEESTGFPGAGYSLNIPLTKCEDQMGNKVSNVEITGNGTNVTVTSKYTVYCTLYFDKGTSLSQFCNGVDLKTCIGNKKDYIGDVSNMTTSLVGGMYRYQGIDNVNNYICFGTTSNCGTSDTNIDKYMYRIIGVTPEGELKLMKEVSLLSDFEEIYDYKDSSSLRTKLNGSGFLGNETYITSLWKDKIMSHTWLYGRTGILDSTNLYNGNYMYEIESGQKEVTFVYAYGNSASSDGAYRTTEKWDESVDDKVGLLYIHDFLLSYPRGNPITSENAIKSWIKPNNREYFITSSRFYVNAPRHNESYFLNATGIERTNVSTYGYNYSQRCATTSSQCSQCMSYCNAPKEYGGQGGENCDTYCQSACGTSSECELYKTYYKPVFYVTSSIKIKSGTGTSSDPYILDV